MIVTVRPHDPSAFVTLMLPPGLKPVRANLPGTISSVNNRWRSTFVAPPADGVMWRLVFAEANESRLGETAVFVQTAGGPEPWMPRAVTAWSVRSLHIIPVGPMLAAPPSGQ
jgi:hypothetical protein